MAYTPPFTPYAHQTEGRNKRKECIRRGNRGFAYLMEMGTGKSKCAADDTGEWMESGEVEQALILAPKGVYANWHYRELPTHLPDSLQNAMHMHIWTGGHTVQEKNDIRELMGGGTEYPFRVLTMNLEAVGRVDRAFELAKLFLKRKRTHLIVDETSTIKNPQAEQTKACLRLRDLAAYHCALTGLPNPNGPLDMFSQMDFVKQGLLGSSWYAARAKYAITAPAWFNIPGQFEPDPDNPGRLRPRQRRVDQIVNYRNLDDMYQRIDPYSFRALKADCLDLPDKTYRFRDVEMTNEQWKIYRQVRDNAFAMLGSADQGTVTVNMIITQMLRLQQIVCGHVTNDDGVVMELSSNRPTELLNEIEEMNSNAVIWSRFIPDIKRIVRTLEKAYGPGCCAEYHGGLDFHEAEANLSQFLAGTKRFFVGTQQKGGYGNTLTIAADSLFYSNSYSLEHRLQSEARTDRAGQLRPTTFVDLRCEGTVEDRVIQALRRKIDLSTLVLQDGYRAWLV